MRIGIDLGGSHIGVGLVNEEKILYKYEKNFTKEDKKDIKQAIKGYISEAIQNISELWNLENIEMIGISMPRKNTKWYNYKFT